MESIRNNIINTPIKSNDSITRLCSVLLLSHNIISQKKLVSSLDNAAKVANFFCQTLIDKSPNTITHIDIDSILLTSNIIGDDYLIMYERMCGLLQQAQIHHHIHTSTNAQHFLSDFLGLDKATFPSKIETIYHGGALWFFLRDKEYANLFPDGSHAFYAFNTGDVQPIIAKQSIRNTDEFAHENQHFYYPFLANAEDHFIERMTKDELIAQCLSKDHITIRQETEREYERVLQYYVEYTGEDIDDLHKRYSYLISHDMFKGAFFMMYNINYFQYNMSMCPSMFIPHIDKIYR